jgi:hypothetical protein
MKIRNTVPGIAFASLLLAAAPAHAQLFKCVNAQGRTVYQDQPCEDKSKQTTIRGAPAAAPAAPAEEPKDAPKEDPNAPDKPIAELTRAAIEVVVGYAMCSERVPGFAEKHNTPYEAWKRRNDAEMKKMNNRAEARLLNERLRVERTRTEGFDDRCDAFGAQLAASGPAASTPTKQ